MNQKRLIIILVAVIVVLAGAVGYFVLVKESEPVTQEPMPIATQIENSNSAPQPAPTVQPIPMAQDESIAGWKTYRNNEYEFKYPPNWYTIEKEDSVLVRENIVNTHFAGISIKIIDDSTENVVSRIRKNIESEPLGKLEDDSAMVFTGVPARGIIHLDAMGSSNYEIVVSYNERTFWISTIPNVNKIDEILSTFKFTK